MNDTEIASQAVCARLQKLIESLGFHENLELAALRHRMSQAHSVETARLILGEYQRVGQAVADRAPDERVRIGLDIASADMWREYRDEKRFIQGLCDARLHAHHAGYDEISQQLWEIISMARPDRHELAPGSGDPDNDYWDRRLDKQ